MGGTESAKDLEPLLPSINGPQDIKDFTLDQLERLAQEVRDHMVKTVARTGGHLGAGLGVVELTVALHHVFDTPHDRLIWDVGHQSYPHKILTGRKDRLHTLRQKDGLSGFTNRTESVFDPFGAGHSSTSISAGLGMAVARDLDGRKNKVICVIGDGSMSAGQAYEAMNNAGDRDSDLIVILNDNDMSIAPPVGAMSAYLSKLISSKQFRSLRHAAKEMVEMFPDPIERAAKKAEEYARGMLTGGTLFEELGFYYIGPIDGHRIDHLEPVLRNVREAEDAGPVLIHVVTRKGCGYEPAEQAPDKYHGVSRFDVITGAQAKPAATAPSYTSVFAKAIEAEASADPKVLAITAAMPAGTGLDGFAEKFPERFFDVGIAEQHAVTFAAGLACEGYKPFCAIYSTFLQRAFDQVAHDVALQNLPVRFAIDRAGFVGADGPTHHGAFDLNFLCCLPNMVVMAPADEVELMHMVATACATNDRPTAIRYPRGEGMGLELPERGTALEIGKGRIVREGSTVALLSLGARLTECLKAADDLAARGLSATVADARFAKPFDTDLVRRLIARHEVLVMVEEGAVGGFGAQVLHYLTQEGLLDDGRVKVRCLAIPDQFIEQDTPQGQQEAAGLTAEGIVASVLTALDRERAGSVRA